MKKLFLILPIWLVSGCQMWEQITSHSEEIVAGGQAAIDSAPVISAFNPALGLWIVAIGGVVVAVGKMLNLFKEKE